jgi:enterochelin esterase family protein
LQNNNYQLWWKELPEGHSWGLWRATLDDMLMFFFPNEPSSIKDKAEVLEGFQLYQNYPNPFNPTTKISWQSPVGSWQTLKVYDVLGKEVATLVDGYKEAGIHKIEFNIVETRRSVSLPSGVYFYQLKIGDYIQTKKMILVR